MDGCQFSSITCHACKKLHENLQRFACGHIFCSMCWDNFPSTSTAIKRCPSCDAVLYARDDDGFDYRVSEDMVKQIIKKQGCGKRSHENDEDEERDRRLEILKRISSVLLKKERFEEALEVLRGILSVETNVNRIMFSFDKIRCEIKLGRLDHASCTAVHITSLIDRNLHTNKLGLIVDSAVEQIEDLIEMFKKANHCNCVLMLLKSMLDVAVAFMKGKRLLKIMIQIATIVSELAENLSPSDEKQHAMCKMLLDSTLEETKLTEFNDLKLKSSFVVSIVLACGVYYITIRDWQKGIELFQNAIFLTETVFASKAFEFQSFGHCYNHLGVCFAFCGFKDLARASHEQALEIYAVAKDWEDEAEGESCILKTYDHLDKLDEKGE